MPKVVTPRENQWNKNQRRGESVMKNKHLHNLFLFIVCSLYSISILVV